MAAILLVALAAVVWAFEETQLGAMHVLWVRIFALPLIAPALTIVLWAYTSRLERRSETNIARGALVLLIILSFAAALIDISSGHTFSVYYGVLLLLLATKIRDQRLVISGVIATVCWLSMYFGIVYTGYSLLLFITAALIMGCILVPKHLRDTSPARR